MRDTMCVFAWLACLHCCAVQRGDRPDCAIMPQSGLCNNKEAPDPNRGWHQQQQSWLGGAATAPCLKRGSQTDLFSCVPAFQSLSRSQCPPLTWVRASHRAEEMEDLGGEQADVLREQSFKRGRTLREFWSCKRDRNIDSFRAWTYDLSVTWQPSGHPATYERPPPFLYCRRPSCKEETNLKKIGRTVLHLSEGFTAPFTCLVSLALDIPFFFYPLL